VLIRTAFRFSNLSVFGFSKKKRTPLGVRFFLLLILSLDITFRLRKTCHVSGLFYFVRRILHFSSLSQQQYALPERYASLHFQFFVL